MKWTGTAQNLAMAVGLGFIVLFLALAVQRLLYPFELTWIESYMYAPLLRRLQGSSIYTEPSFTYTACNYPPLYFNLAAWVSRILGFGPERISFLPMRLVSFLATLATTSTVAYVLRVRRGCGWAVTIALSSVYLASFGRFEGWQDSSRVDAVMCLFFFLGAAFLLEGTGWPSALLAGLFAGLAGVTKQPALVYVAAIGLYLAVAQSQWKRPIIAGLVAAVVVLGYLATTGDLFNRYFYYWTFEIPGHHPRHWYYLGRGFGFLAATIPLLLVVGLWPLASLAKRGHRSSLKQVPRWSGALAVTMLCALLLRTKEGASINFFLPVFLLAAVAWAEAANRLVRKRPRFAPLFASALVVQLLMLAYDPRVYFPTRRDSEQAQSIVAALRRIDGPVWFAAFPSYAAFAGKPWVLQDAGRLDLAPAYYTAEISRLVEQGHWGALVLPANRNVIDLDLVTRRYHGVTIPYVDSPFFHFLHDANFVGTLYVRNDLLPAFSRQTQEASPAPAGML